MLLLLLLITAGIDASVVVRDVSVDFLLESKVLPDNYSEVWQLTNNDHQTGQTDSLNVFVEYSHNDVSGNYSRTLNRFTRAGPPTFELGLGVHEFCVNVTPLNFEDPNLDNNFVCKTINATLNFEDDESEEELEELIQEENHCECDFNLKIDDEVVRSGETIRYSFDFCKSTYPLPVTYWIEDLHGVIVRNPVHTTSSAKKSFTPNHDLNEKSFVIKGEVQDCKLYAKGVIGSTNPTAEPFLEVRVPDIVNFGDKFNVEVNGVKDSTKRVLSVFLEQNGVRYSDEIKVYVDTEKFSFIMPLYLPEKSIEYSGVYHVVVSGLDLHHEEKVFVFGVEKEEPPIILNPKLSSFYTRKQLFEETLNVNYLVENTFSGRLDILTSKGNFSTPITTRTGSLEVGITHPNEVIIGLLYNSANELKDLKHIKLNLTMIKEEVEEQKNATLPSIQITPPKVSRVRLVLGRIFGI